MIHAYSANQAGKQISHRELTYSKRLKSVFEGKSLDVDCPGRNLKRKLL